MLDKILNSKIVGKILVVAFSLLGVLSFAKIIMEPDDFIVYVNFVWDVVAAISIWSYDIKNRIDRKANDVLWCILTVILLLIVIGKGAYILAAIVGILLEAIFAATFYEYMRN